MKQFKLSVSFHTNTTTVNIHKMESVAAYVYSHKDAIEKLWNDKNSYGKNWHWQQYGFSVPFTIFELLAKELSKYNRSHTNTMIILNVDNEPLCIFDQAEKYYTHVHIGCGGEAKEHTLEAPEENFIGHRGILYCNKCKEFIYKKGNFTTTFI